MFLKTKSKFLLNSTRKYFSSNWLSLINLTEDQNALRDMVEKFGKSEIAPIAKQIDKDDHFPREIFNKLGELGLLGMTIPGQYGGSDLGYFEHCLVLEEISRYSASTINEIMSIPMKQY